MNFSVVSIALFAVMSALVVIFIRSYRPEYALLASIAAGIILLLGVIATIGPVLKEIESITESAGIDPEYFSIVIKALGICYITQFAADTCRDFGQTALSGKVELMGRAAILLMSFPLIKNVITMITGFIK